MGVGGILSLRTINNREVYGLFFEGLTVEIVDLTVLLESVFQRAIEIYTARHGHESDFMEVHTVEYPEQSRVTGPVTIPLIRSGEWTL